MANDLVCATCGDAILIQPGHSYCSNNVGNVHTQCCAYCVRENEYEAEDDDYDFDEDDYYDEHDDYDPGDEDLPDDD